MTHTVPCAAPGGWASTISLRFSGHHETDGRPPTLTTPLFTGGGFGAAYNENRTLMIPLPKVRTRLSPSPQLYGWMYLDDAAVPHAMPTDAVAKDPSEQSPTLLHLEW
jgi:hypothetical protein